ncbi:MAG: ion transporter [Proteobacteria bacterium]|nr:ion transporter [Pseudomonadota bacterium]
MFSPYAIIDFLAILPFYLLIGGFFGDVDMRFLRSIRLLRILKLTRYSSAFDMLMTTCRENTRPLLAAFFVLITVMLLAASGMYFFERQAFWHQVMQRNQNAGAEISSGSESGAY